jgi:hypothetical protein
MARKCFFTTDVHTRLIVASWSSICRGATMWGLENKKEEKQRTVIERLARRHYGFWIATPFNESKHDVAHKYKHSDGSWRCDVMDWKLALVCLARLLHSLSANITRVLRSSLGSQWNMLYAQHSPRSHRLAQG